MRTFTRKGFGRIYVSDPDQIKIVESIIAEMDDFEYGYLPEGMITSFSSYPHLTYTGKFDALDLDELTAKCFSNGIYIFCIDNGHSEFVSA